MRDLDTLDFSTQLSQGEVSTVALCEYSWIRGPHGWGECNVEYDVSTVCSAGPLFFLVFFSPVFAACPATLDLLNMLLNINDCGYTLNIL